MIKNLSFKAKAIELYNGGEKNAAEIARFIISNMNYPKDHNNARRMVLKWIHSEERAVEHFALAAECSDVGIPLDSVKHGWYKGEHWSIAFRPEEGLEAITFEEMLKDHIEEVTKHTFKYKNIIRKPLNRPHLLLIDPADIHIGKLASSFETGEEYNNQIAVERVRQGVDGIIQKAHGFNIEQIVFVAGNDILHIDTPKRTTTSGTPVDTCGMWYDNFLIAKRLYIEIIEKLLQISNVHFMYNPSNHDYVHGFFLADAISNWFRECKNITFDVSISHRKYYTYGENLIGTTHGDGAKWQDLSKLASVECKDWSNVKHRYIYTHHVHHKIVKDDIGCTIESLRSPSGTDGWHHRNGYQHAPKAVEGFIHSKEHGQVARFTHLF